MRVLVLSNMKASGAHPERGRFVRDQVDALRQLPDIDLTLHEISSGIGELLRAGPRLWRRYRRQRFDVVHAHFSLTALPALPLRGVVRGLTLHGTDVRHPRTRLVTAAVLPLIDIVVAVSEPLAEQLPGAAARRRALVIPCGVDLRRFRPIPRSRARAELGLDPQQPCLLFPADPERPAKRHALALALAQAAGVPLLTLGGVPPERVPLLVNAANAVLITSESEGFGLAALEALACDVPVLATPVGVHPVALRDIQGALCAPFQLETWMRALRPHLQSHDPRIAGRSRAEQWSADEMAARLAQAWRESLRAAQDRPRR